MSGKLRARGFNPRPRHPRSPGQPGTKGEPPKQKYRVTCYACGGEGSGDGCTCFDDTCCCLVPTPPECDICGGEGSFIVTELTEDNCCDAIPVYE